MRSLIAWIVERPRVGWPAFFACWIGVSAILILVGAPFFYGMGLALLLWIIAFAWHDAWEQRR